MANKKSNRSFKINGTKVKSKVDKNKTKKKRKTQKNKKRIWYWILIGVTGFAILMFFLIIAFGIYIIFSAPTFDPDMLYEKESTTIYDMNGTLIATLGTSTGEGTAEKRKKITYEELPEVLIDAIVATEDSRYFQHNGFDFARFAKASLGQLLGQSDSGGASTITMQVVKNTFTSNIASGIKGIIRKFTDIYMAVFKVEKNYTKEQIFEFYVNSPYLGSGSYGVEQASTVYFGKSASDLSLTEAALIAGLFQAPNGYDPYLHPQAAEARRNTVLSLMVRHGYITENEAEIAKSVPVQTLLASDSAYSTNPYQGFIDTAVQEVIDKTGQDPYSVPMEIYTTMDPTKQDVINSLYDGTLGYNWDNKKHAKMQFAATLLDNDTGAIRAIGAGRNRTGEMSFNYATMIKRHPGSTAKPIFDYGPGMEYQKWSTYTPFLDDITTYRNGKKINNWNHDYVGLCTLKKCLSKSINTTALQAFQRNNNEDIYKFATSLGVEVESEDGHLHEAHSIGSFSGMSPTSMAGAYSAFANGGYYTEPYSVTKVIYKDTGEIYETKVKRDKVMSPATAYMITDVLFNVTPGSVSVKGTRVATKTGTSSYEDSALKAKGITADAIQDSWVATYSPKYTLAFWLGYDELYEKDYFTMSYASSERNKIQGKLVNAMFEKNSSFKKPSGVVAAKVELETFPAQSPSEFTPSDLIETHYFVSGTEPAETSKRFSRLDDPSNVSVSQNGSTATVTWTSPAIPNAIDTTYLTNLFKENYGTHADKYLQKRIDYNNNVFGNFGFDIYLTSGGNTQYIAHTTNTSYTLNTTGYDGIIVKTAYEKFKSNASNGITKAIENTSSTLSVEVLPINGTVNPTFTKGSSLPTLDSSTIMVTYNGVDASSLGLDLTINYTITDKNGITSTSLSSISTTEDNTYTIKYTVNYNGTTASTTRTITITN